MAIKTKSKERNESPGNSLVLPLSVTLAILPIIMTPYGIDMYALPKATFLYLSTMLLTIIYISRSIKAGKFEIYRSPLDLPVLLIIIYATLSLIFSSDPLLGLVGKYKRYENFPALVCYAGIYFFSVQAIRHEKDIMRAIKAMAIGFLSAALYGLFQASGLDFPTVTKFGSKVHSSLGNPVLFGAYLLIMLPLLFSLARNVGEHRWRLIAWFLIIIGLINLYYTESKGAWLGIPVAVIAMTALSRKATFIAGRITARGKSVRLAGHARIADSKNKLLLILAVIALVILLAAPFIELPDDNSVKRIISALTFSDISATTRIEIWKASLKMISDRPLFGFGLEQMGYWFPVYKTAEHIRIAPIGMTDRTHNDALQVAVDIGIPGLFFYLWAFSTAFLSLLNKKRSQQRITPYVTGIFGALAGYLAHGQTGIPAVFVTPMLWSLLGVLSTTTHTARTLTVSIPRSLRPKLVTMPIAIVFAGLTILALRPVVADVYVYNGWQTSSNSIDQAAPEFETALRIFPYQSDYKKAMAEYYLDYASYSQNLLFARRASLIAEQGLVYNKRNFELAYYVGEASFLEYKLTESQASLIKAEKYYKLASDLWPSLSLTKNKLLELAVIRGDEKNAAKLAEELVEMGQEDPRLYYILATFAENKGDFEKSKRYFKKVEELDPGFLLKTRRN